MLRRQKHVLSQSTTPFACTLQKKFFSPEYHKIGGRAIHRPIPVLGKTLDELSAPLVHMNIPEDKAKGGHWSMRISPELRMDH